MFTTIMIWLSESTIQNWKNVFNCSISSAPSWIVRNQNPETWYGTWVWKGKAICRIERLVWKLRSISWMVNHRPTGFKIMNKMSSLLFYSTITPLIRQSMWKVPNWTENETMNHLSKADCIIKIGIICILAIKLQLLVSP